MTGPPLNRWFRALGYDTDSPAFHPAERPAPVQHRYAPELRDLLKSHGGICARAVFDVEGTPTVCFFEDDHGGLLKDEARLNEVRQRIWNQNLISVVLVLTEQCLVPVPISRRHALGQPISLKNASPTGAFSSADVQSGDVRTRYDKWFRPEDRVDRQLLANLRITIAKLVESAQLRQTAFTSEDAQYLLGQVLFVSYLEHRGIVSDHYRRDRGVGELGNLTIGHDRKGILTLLTQLKEDFNGDFLERPTGKPVWTDLPDAGFDIIGDFLAATDMESGQLNMWPYDFRYIPVELLSGIYESFLGSDTKDELAAHYTPRHLANLVVDQAFSESPDILAERIYDGACGSGILLTTAFRRLLGEAEHRNRGNPVPLADRVRILKDHIYGSDISESACRVTAFSLYLSLLEGLVPADIAALQDDTKIKLPPLRRSNLNSGQERGDFFSPKNPHFKDLPFTLFLSNPPWKEIAVQEYPTVKRWAEKSGAVAPLGQLAALFAWRATEALASGGRLCLILPMTLVLKPSSQEFLASWLELVSIRRLINFGDLKELLFPGARSSCVVLLGEIRSHDVKRANNAKPQWRIPPTESFDYWAPKADVGLCFGRLTLHGTDRHRVHTRSIAHSNRELVTRMWGDDFDLSVWGTLRLRGMFGDLFSGPRKRWTLSKGFHREDKSIKPAVWVKTDPLWDMPFVRPQDLYDIPVVTQLADSPFPKDEMPKVPRLPQDLLTRFQGPRILFPDGPAPDRSLRAAFTNRPGSFMSSVGVIAGPREDEDLLRFAAMYLRSNLVRYFMITQLYQLLSDRDRVSLRDVRQFPFIVPERHTKPDRAHAIVKQIANISRRLENVPPLTRKTHWEAAQPEVEASMQQYFGLDPYAQALVDETVERVLPTMRPYGLSPILERATHRAGEDTIRTYAAALLHELDAWRDARNGTGGFSVRAILTGNGRAGPFGIVQVDLMANQASETLAQIERKDAAVETLLATLRRNQLLPMEISENVYYAADTVIMAGNSVYLIKPQTERLWLRRQARRDAERIVEVTTRSAPSSEAVA